MKPREVMPTIPDDAAVPLKMAHMVIGKSSSTVYRWVAKNLLTATDGPDGLMVRVGDVRKLETTVRHGGRRPKTTRRED